MGALTISASRSAARGKLFEEARNFLYVFYRLVFRFADPAASFIEADVHKGLAFAAMEVDAGAVPRLLLGVPPRHGKSLMFSVVYAAWAMGRTPSLKVFCASYGDKLGLEFARQFRDVVNSPVYREIFPNTVFKSGPLDSQQTTQGGRRDTSSVLGPVTGLGYHLMIIDDPIKAIDAQSEAQRNKVYDWVTGSLMSRFEPGRDPRIAIVMQRLHQDDLIGRLKDDENWIYTCWPARAWAATGYPTSDWGEVVLSPGDLLFPEGFTDERLIEIEADLGPAAFNAQYLQRPESPHGNIIKRAYFRTYNELPNFEAVYQSWDVATTTEDHSAWSVCITFGVRGRDVYIMDVFRERLDLYHLEKRVVQQYETFKPKLSIIEVDGIGRAVIENIWRINGARSWCAASGTAGHSKEQRLHEQMPKIARKRLLLPAAEVPWKSQFLEECLSFPSGRFCDQVDALTQFLRALDNRGFHPAINSLSAYRNWPEQPF